MVFHKPTKNKSWHIMKYKCISIIWNIIYDIQYIIYLNYIYLMILLIKKLSFSHCHASLRFHEWQRMVNAALTTVSPGCCPRASVSHLLYLRGVEGTPQTSHRVHGQTNGWSYKQSNDNHNTQRHQLYSKWQWNDNGSYFLDKKIHNNDDLMFPTVRSL